MDSQWYTCKEGEVKGPFTWEELRGQISGGELQPENLVWKAPYQDWRAAKTIEGLFSPPPPPVMTSQGNELAEVETERSIVRPPVVTSEGNEPGHTNDVPPPPAAAVLTKPAAIRYRRKTLKIVLFSVLGVVLILLAGVFYSIHSFFRDYNDDSLMEEIRAELGGDANTYATRSTGDVAVSTDDNEVKGKLAQNPVTAMLGIKKEEITSRFGEPEDTGFWKGANYYSYSDGRDFLVYFADDLPGVVVGISYFGPQEILGAKVGMTMEEIKSVLGEPDYEGCDQDCTPPEYSYGYKFQGAGIPGADGRNDLEIIFNTSSEEDPINYIDIFSK